jgi:hypothetical protein
MLTTWGGARYARGTLDGDSLGSPLGVLLGSKLGYVDGAALVIDLDDFESEIVTMPMFGGFRHTHPSVLFVHDLERPEQDPYC